MLETIVGHVGRSCKGQVGEQEAWQDTRMDSAEVKAKIHDHVDQLFFFLDKQNDRRSFDEVERGLRGFIFALGRLPLTYLVARRGETPERSVGK